MGAPTPVQRLACPVVRASRDCIAIAETGQGKTAVFLVPLLAKLIESGNAGQSRGKEGHQVARPEVVIIAPTRELALQIETAARRLAVDSGIFRSIGLVYGGASMDDQAEQLSRGVRMLIGTVGRLLDFIQRGCISVDNVNYLVIDEADRQLMDGFEESLQQFLRLPDLPPSRVTIMTSATMSPEVQFLARQQLHADFCYCLVGGLNQANLNIDQEVLLVRQKNKFEKLEEVLRRPEVQKKRTIVFMNSRRKCQTHSIQLGMKFGTCVEAIHGDRHQRDREYALERFKRGEATILVSTDVIGRGIDIADVALIINFDLPKKINEYNNRIGRTARIGHSGRAISFYDPEADWPIVRRLCQVLGTARQPIPVFLKEEAIYKHDIGFADSDKYTSNAPVIGYGPKPFDMHEEW